MFDPTYRNLSRFQSSMSLFFSGLNAFSADTIDLDTRRSVGVILFFVITLIDGLMTMSS